MKKKILYIHHGKGIGGAPLSLLYLIQKLDRSKFEPIVFFLYKSELTKLFKDNEIIVLENERKVELFYHLEPHWFRFYQLHKIIKKIIFWFYYLYYAKTVITKINPDLVHLNSLFLLEWAVATKKINLPCVIHVREPIARGYFKIRYNIIRFILNKYCDKVICISEDNKRRLKLNENKALLIYNSVDFNFFKKIEKKNIDRQITVLYLGGDNTYKGFNTIVDSLEFLESNITVLFCGYYQLNNFKNLHLKKLNQSKNGKLLGMVTNLPLLFADIDILVVPYTISHFARPIIEAGAMGKAVIASNVNGMDEIVIDKYNGLLFVKENYFDLASKINYLSKNPELQHELGRNGYELAISRYDSTLNSKKIMQIYDSILKKC